MKVSAISIFSCIIFTLVISSCKQKEEAFDPGVAANGTYIIYAIDTNTVQYTIAPTSMYTIKITKNSSTSADIIQTTATTKVFSGVRLSDSTDYKTGLSYASSPDTLSGYAQESFVVYTINSGTNKIKLRGKKY